MKRAFGVIEAILLAALIAATAWGVGSTIKARAATPVWMQPPGSLWV
jgi:hypothetical protein